MGRLPGTKAATTPRTPGFRLGRLAFAMLGPVMLTLAAADAGAQISPNDIAPARDVLAALAKKDHAQARKLADGLPEPLHKKALLWHLAQSREVPFTFSELAALHDGVKNWPLAARIAERAEDTLAAADGDAAMLGWFAANPPRSPKGWTNYIYALARTQGDAKTAEAAKRAWTTAAFTARDESQFLSRFGKYLAPEDHRRRLLLLLRARRTEQARVLWNRALLPAEDKAAAALRIMMQSGAGEPAGIEAQIARLPDAIVDDPDFRYDWMMWHRRAQRRDAAGKVLERLPVPVEDARRWRADGAQVVRELLDAGDAEAAYRAASVFADGLAAGPVGENWATMDFLAGWIALRRLAKPVEAGRHFERLFEKSGASITKARGAYWAYRAAAARNDTAAADRWLIEAAGFPQVFYGQLAIAALGREQLALPADIAAEEYSRKILIGNEITRAATLFAALGERAPARALVLHLATEADEPQRWAAVTEFADRLERREAAVRAARRASVRNVPLYAAGFPTLALPIDSSVETAFALAIIRQESEFNLAAVSPSGARGLMQLMPATAREGAQRLKLRFELGKLTEDETYNLRLGTDYLSRLVRRFGGLYPLAAAAYNAGPGNLNRWLARYGDPRDGKVDLIDWIESIPFDETRNYVHRVIENLAIYRHRAGLKSLAAEPGAIWRPPAGDSLKIAPAPPPLP